MAKVKHILISLIALLMGLYASAQSLAEAQEAYQLGDLTKAQTIINHYFSSNNTLGVEAYYLKGYIYKDLYKNDERQDTDFALRSQSLKAYKKAYDLDTQNEYRSDIEKNVKFLVVNTYNEGIRKSVGLQTEQHDAIYTLTEQYISITGMPEHLIAMIKYEYLMATGNAYLQLSEETKNTDDRNTYAEKALNTYNTILGFRTDDYDVNYHIGLVYYNKAVDIINHYDGLVSIEELQEIEEKTIALFNQALPYMEKAHELNPDNKHVLEALAGIHFSLKNFDLSDKYINMIK